MHRRGPDMTLDAERSAILGVAEMTDTALVIPPGLPYEDWAAMAQPLLRIAQASMWWIGDLLLYGEHEYGEKYVQAIEATGYALSTLKNAQWVADRFPPDQRRDDATFSQHKTVASLPPDQRAALIQRAAEEHMTEGELAGRVKAIKAAEKSPSETRDTNTVEVIPPSIPKTVGEAVERAIAVLDQATVREDWSLVKQANEILTASRKLAVL